MESLRGMERSFNKDLFNDDANYGLFRNSLYNQPDLFQFFILRVVSTYKQISKVVMEFKSSRRLYHHHVVLTQSSDGVAVFGFKMVLNCQDHRCECLSKCRRPGCQVGGPDAFNAPEE